MTNNRLKGFTYGAVALPVTGMNPLFALPLYGAGMSVDSVLFTVTFRRCDAGHPDESEETVLCAEEGGYTSAGGNGGCCSLFPRFFLFESYNYMDAGIASTILFVYPVLVAIIMAVFFHEKVSFITMFSIALAFTGISLLYEGGDGKTLSMLGVLFVILSSLTYAIYIVGVNRSSLKELPTAKTHFLCFALRHQHLCGASGLLHGFAARPFAGAVGKCPFAGFVSHYHFAGADDALHPPHRLHAGCHIGGAGTGDGAVLRRSGVWRAAHSAHHARRTDDTYCRDTDNCGETVAATGEEAHRLKSGSFFCRDKVFFAGYQKGGIAKKCSIFAA